MHLGYNAVDGFFLLTGFLLAYPLFVEKKKLDASSSTTITTTTTTTTTTATTTTTTPIPSSLLDLSSYYYRRLARLLPPYFLLLFLYCGVFFTNGQFPLALCRNDKMRVLTLSGFPDAEKEGMIPSKCGADSIIAHVLFINQLTPFGGCVGYTWSLAIQVSMRH